MNVRVEISLQAASLLTDYISSRDDRVAPVTRLAAPEELHTRFEQVMPHSLESRAETL